MIRMISGATRIGSSTMTPEIGAFAADPAVESRLVDARVAEYVHSDVAMPGVNEADTADLQTGDVEIADAVEIVDGHMTIDSLMQLTRNDMEKMADEMGVDISKCKNKSDIANLLSAVEVQAEISDEAAPNLGAEDPIV